MASYSTGARCPSVLPRTVQEALRHFNIVEFHITPLINLICFSATNVSASILLRKYKRLEMFIHPDRCKGDEINATCSMQTIVRAKAMFHNNIEYRIPIGDIDSELNFVLSYTVMYTVLETNEDK